LTWHLDLAGGSDAGMNVTPYKAPQTEIVKSKPHRAVDFSMVIVGIVLLVLYVLAWLAAWVLF